MIIILSHQTCRQEKKSIFIYLYINLVNPEYVANRFKNLKNASDLKCSMSPCVIHTVSEHCNLQKIRWPLRPKTHLIIHFSIIQERSTILLFKMYWLYYTNTLMFKTLSNHRLNHSSKRWKSGFLCFVLFCFVFVFVFLFVFGFVCFLFVCLFVCLFFVERPKRVDPTFK